MTRPAHLPKIRPMTAAIYSRFSTDKQSETSVEAQERLCRARADALGVSIVATHADQAVSGSTPVELRAAGRALLADAMAGRITLLLVEGLDRLSRDIGEQDRIVKRLEHRGVRIVGISDGYDSLAAGRKVMRVARGLVNELYLDDLRAKVHRSLSNKAATGHHVAGISYGYRSEAAAGGKRLTIVAEEAAIVREIFAAYGAGGSCQRIAADLNRRAVPSPRGSTWMGSALYGSPAKGSGILNNALYIGRYVWNRSQWVKDPDTGQRQRMDRPRAEWLVDDRPELRIVDEQAWQAVRQRIDPGLGHGYRGGRTRTLFGGLLRCGICGGALVATDAYRYACCARKDRGAAVCPGTHAPRRETDRRLLSALRDELGSPATIAGIRQRATSLLAARSDGSEARTARLAALQREIGHVVDAVAQSGHSNALQARLEAAELEHANLTRVAAFRSTVTVEDVVARYRRYLLDLSTALQQDTARARQALAQVLGEIRITNLGTEVWADVEMRPERVMLATGTHLDVVAGARYLAHLRLRIR